MLIDVKKSAIFIAVALACSLALVGCSSKEKQLVGKWKIDTTKLPASMTSGPGAAMAKGFMSSMSVEFKPDKKFAMTMIVPIEGTWTLDGSTVTLTMTSMMGMSLDQIKQQAKNSTNPTAASNMQSLEKPLTGTLSDDGKSLLLAQPGQKDALTFAKDTS